MARAHLAVMLARPLLEGAALYPAAMARLRVAKEQAAQARPARAGSAIARGWPWGRWLAAGRGSRQPEAWPHLAQAGALAGLLAAGDGPAEAELRI